VQIKKDQSGLKKEKDSL